jgi:hypothetical protein
MAKMPLMKKVLIAAGYEIPAGLDPDDVVVIAPEDLGAATLSEIMSLAGDGEMPPEGDLPPEGELPPEHDEGAEGLEEEVAESPETQEAEALAGTEMHGPAELKQMAEDSMAQLDMDADVVERIAKVIPDAKGDAKEYTRHIEAARKVLDKLADVDDEDAEKAQKLSAEFMEHVDAALASCAACKALVPSLEPEADEPSEEEPAEGDEPTDEGVEESTAGMDLSGWAQQTG